MSNSRTKNSILNMVSSIGYQMISLVMSFISRTIFLQVLGVGYLGINGLFNDVLSMLNMAELGFGTAMTFSMYKPLAEKDYDTIAGLTNFYKKVYRIIAATILTLGVALLPFLPHLINLDQDIPFIEVYYLIFLMCNVASYLVTYKTTVLYADQKNYLMLQHGAVWHVAEVCAMLLVLYISHNYLFYLLTQLVFVYGRNFYMSRLASKHCPYLNRKIKLPKERTKGIFKDVGSAFLYKIANVLITGTDNTLISILISTEMVGFYSNYQIITAKIGTIVSTVFSSLITSIGNLLAQENSERKFQVFQTMQSVCLMMTSFFVTCILVLQEDLIRVWIGEEFVLGHVALIAIVFKFYFDISIMPVTSFREAAGLFRKTKFLMLWTAVINIVLSIVLGRQIGLAGIIFATSISKLFTSFWYEPRLLFKDYFKNPCRIYFMEMFLGLIKTLFVVIIVGGVSQYFVPDGWLALIGKGIIVAALSLIATIVLYCRTPGFELVLSKVKSMIKR